MNRFVNRLIGTGALLCLAAALFAPAALAQTTGIWSIQVWEQDNGGPYDQFAPFCEFGTPCTLVEGVEICIGANCQTTNASGQVNFPDLVPDTYQACIQDPSWAVESGSAGGEAVDDQCVERTVSAGDNNTTAMYVASAVVDIEITSVENTDDPVIAGSGTNNMSYTFTVTNNGPGNATNVVTLLTVVTDFAPSCSIPVSQGSLAAGGVWTVGSLASGASATLSSNCTVNADVQAGATFSHTLSLTSVDQIDTDDTNDSSTQESTVTRVATFAVQKSWAGEGGGEVDVALVCNDVVVDSATTSGGSAELTVTDFADSTECVVEETVPPGFSPTYTEGCSADPTVSASLYECGITNAETRATFAVTKDFTDGNPGEVEVSISCNTGLPLDQSKAITEDEGVTFVVVDFDDGEMDCEVTEVPIPGYETTYYDGTTTSSTSCEFLEVAGGAELFCEITNEPGPVDIVITKDWVFEGSSDPQGIDLEYQLTLWCDAEIVGGYHLYNDLQETPSGNGSGCGLISISQEGGQGYYSADWCKRFWGHGPDVFGAQVIPEYPDSHCFVIETVYDDAVEVDNGCTSLTVSAGQGAACTITNTVFFEGIPTLDQYGKLLLILLMLGMGMVAYRRIV